MCVRRAGNKGIPMRKWILRFGTGLGMVLAGTSMNGCLWNTQPETKRPTKTPANNGFNSNPNGSQPANTSPGANLPTSGSGVGANATTGSGVNATRTSGTIGDPLRPTGAVNDPTFKPTSMTNSPAANTQASSGTLQPINGSIQPVSASNPGSGSGLTPIATSAGRLKSVTVNGVTSIDSASSKDPAQPDPVPSLQPPPPVSFQSSDRQLQRYQPPAPPLMTGATEAQTPIKAIDPAKPQ